MLPITIKKYTEKGEIMADCNREHEYRLDKADERLDKLTDCLNGVTFTRSAKDLLYPCES